MKLALIGTTFGLVMLKVIVLNELALKAVVAIVLGLKLLVIEGGSNTTKPMLAVLFALPLQVLNPAGAVYENVVVVVAVISKKLPLYPVQPAPVMPLMVTKSLAVNPCAPTVVIVAVVPASVAVAIRFVLTCTA